MPAASAYQNNDYQSISTYQPYRLPSQEIARAVMAQNQFWNEGAMRVKSVYDNALGLNLVTDENKSIRDNYMRDAEKQLSKLSSMDLSDPSVQKQGISLFKPLLNDQNIIGEDYVVRNLNKELSTGLSYRTRNSGKEYNPLSVENIQYEKQLLSSGLNKRDGWKSLYQNMSTYTPQIDTAAELKKITDVVKASETKNAQLAGDEWYIQEISKKGVSKEKILEAIDTMGSPQLKAQMRVEGRNTFYKHLYSDPSSLDSYYQGVATNLFNSKIQDVRNSKAEVDYQNYMVPDKSENRSKKDAFTRVSDELKKSINDLETVQRPKYVSDYRNLSNLDNLSSNLSKIEQLWQSASVHELAPALAWESSSQEIKPNNAKIAKENVKVAYQRLNLQALGQGETKRHNIVEEGLSNDRNQIELLKALKPGATKGVKGAGGNIIFGDVGGSGGVSVPGTLSANPNESDISKIAEDQRNTTLGQLGKFDENLRESAITNIISPNAWTRVQKNIDTNIPISQTLTDVELDKAAAFMKSFADKTTSKAPSMGGTSPVSSGTIEGWKATISKMTPSQFKQKMGDIMKEDPDLVADVSTKLFEETKDINGQLKVAGMRAAANANARLNLNLSKNIFTRQVPALGEFSNLFDNGGNVPLTDQNIRKAYEKGLASHQMIRNYNSGFFEGLVGIKDRTYTPKGQESEIMSLQEFTKEIRKRTDPIFYNIATETNVQTSSFYYGNTAEDKARKFQDMQALPNIAQYQNSDNRKDVEKVLSFIDLHKDKVAGYQVQSPQGAETLPNMKVSMEDLSKEDTETWKDLKDVKIPIIMQGQDKSFNQKSSPSAEFRYPNAVIATTHINNAEKGEITIENQTSGSDIDAAVSVKNVYRIVDGKRVDITPREIEEAVLRQWPGETLNSVASTNPEALNTLLSQVAISIELQNKKAKEKTK